MVVDDEYEMCRVLRDVFQREGHQCLTTTDSTYALTMLEDIRPDVLVLDLLMPDTNGWQVLRRARQLDPKLPVILFTALDSGDVGFRAGKEGAFAYLRKGSSGVAELRDTVAAAVAWREAQP